jgi:hypothetical protein
MAERLAERRAAHAVERAKRRIAGRVDAPGVQVRVTEAGVELSGRGLARRLLTDGRLRWLGGLVR